MMRTAGWVREQRVGLVQVVILLVLGAPAVSEAALVVAEWLPRNGDWNDPAGWSTNPIVPNNDLGTTFDVRIPVDANIRLGSDIVVDHLDLALGSSLRSILGTTSVTVQESMHWHGGAFFLGNQLTTNGTTLVDGAIALLDRWDYRNNGQLTLADVTMSGSDSRFENSVTGLVRLEGETPRLRFTSIVNDGAIVRTGGSGRATIEGGGLVNRGTVDLQSGGLLLGDSTGFSIRVENFGRIQGAVGTLLELGGFFQDANASTETGGDLLIVGGRIDGDVSVGGTLTTRQAVSFSAASRFEGRSLEVGQFSTTRFEGQSLDLEDLDLMGNLFVAGDLFVSGDLRWLGEIATAGTARLAGDYSMGGGLRGALENAGVLDVGPGASIATASVLTNLAGATLRTDDASRITGGGRIVNLGVHRHAAAIAPDRELQVQYENRGTIDVESGSLDFVGALTGDGEVALAGGARLSIIRGTQDILSPGSRVSGAGELVIDSTSQRLWSELDLTGALRVTRGVVEVAGPITELHEVEAGTEGTVILSQPGLEIARARIGGFQVGRIVANAPLSITERLDWTNGAIAGAAPVALLGETVVGGLAIIDATRVENAGTMTINRAGLSLVGSGRFVNAAAGQFVHESNFLAEVIGGDGTGSIVNDGLWTNRGNLRVPVPFENNGRLVHELGTLQLDGPGRSSGSIEVASDASLTLGRDFILAPESSISGTGMIRLAGSRELGAGFQFDGTTQLDFGSQLNVVGSARLGSNLAGGTVEISSTAQAGVVSSELFVRSGGDLELERYLGPRIELSEGGIVRATSDGFIAPTNLVGDGAVVGDARLTGTISPPRPPRFPDPRRSPAILSPGGGRLGTSALGELGVDGNLSLNVTNVVIELAGVDPRSEHDVVRVRDAVNLGTESILAISVLGSFADRIDASQTFSVLTAGAGIVGAFVNAPFGGRLTTFDGSGSFLLDRLDALDGSSSIFLSDYQPIPEPGVALSLGLGLFVLSISGCRPDCERRRSTLAGPGKLHADRSHGDSDYIPVS